MGKEKVGRVQAFVAWEKNYTDGEKTCIGEEQACIELEATRGTDWYSTGDHMRNRLV